MGEAGLPRTAPCPFLLPPLASDLAFVPLDPAHLFNLSKTTPSLHFFALWPLLCLVLLSTGRSVFARGPFAVRSAQCRQVLKRCRPGRRGEQPRGEK